MEYKNIIVKKVILDCPKGSELPSALREAAIMVLQEKREVALTHNDREYKIDPLDILDFILKQK